MKVVILAGGLETRLSEETTMRPKPMIEIGSKPILWHIMKTFSAGGVNEFIIALVGYRGEMIEEYFLNFYAFNNDITINLADGRTTIHNGNQPPWKIHLLDTGLHTQTGGRLGRLKKWLEGDEVFLFTYGDGVADIDIAKLIEFHRSHKKIATVTTVRSPERFGRIVFEEDRVVEFFEKPQSGEGWMNGGFFVLNSAASDYVGGDNTIWERECVEKLAHDGQLIGYRHFGFWSCMDTLREKNHLEELWNSGKAPWKVW